jgi:hypothetical protein
MWWRWRRSNERWRYSDSGNDQMSGEDAGCLELERINKHGQKEKQSENKSEHRARWGTNE